MALLLAGVMALTPSPTTPTACDIARDDLSTVIDRMPVEHLIPLMEEVIESCEPPEASHPPSPPTASPAVNPPRRVGVRPGVEQWRSLVAKYFPADQVDRALCIMGYESNGDPNADNPRSSASGLFQHLGKYWPERSVKAGRAGESIWDPDANVAVAGWLWATGGWGHWSPYNRGLCR